MPDATPASILVVEDDPGTADTVALYLRHEGHRVEVARDGRTGLDRARQVGFDLLIVDRMLPGLDGDALCREIRGESDVPVIMLTARTEERDRLEGFDLGADDYVSKPFSPRELIARVRVLLRRAEKQRARRRGVLTVGSLTIDPEGGAAFRASRALALSPTELRLLATLAAAPGRVFSRRELLDRAVAGAHDVDERVVDAHVKNLRRKLDPERGGPSLVETVFGRGYKLVRDIGPDV